MHCHLLQFKALLLFGIYHWCHAQVPFETSMQSYWTIRIKLRNQSYYRKWANTKKKGIRSWQWTVEIALKWDFFFWYRRWYDIVDVMHRREPFETSMQSYWAIRILVCKSKCRTKAFTENRPLVWKKCVHSWQNIVYDKKINDVREAFVIYWLVLLLGIFA